MIMTFISLFLFLFVQHTKKRPKKMSAKKIPHNSFLVTAKIIIDPEKIGETTLNRPRRDEHWNGWRFGWRAETVGWGSVEHAFVDVLGPFGGVVAAGPSAGLTPRAPVSFFGVPEGTGVAVDE